MVAIVNMNVTLDLDLLRVFVAVVDTGSFTAAAVRLNSTQSTVSQKVMRLEQAAEQRLLDRSRRKTQPTEAGEQLLGYARRMLALHDEAAAALSGAALSRTLRLGLPEDFASTLVTPVLAGFLRDHANVRLEVTSGLSRELRHGYEVGEFDLVMLKQRRGSGGVRRWPEPLGWLESAAHPVGDADPLPLVAFPPHGLYRGDMTAALDAIGRRWHIVYTSSSLASLQSAIGDGLGISLLPLRTALPGHRVLPPARGLPVVDTMEIAIHHRDDAPDLVRDIAAALARLVEGSPAKDP
jgi:DNA-binding transcriptional LysR family regulator